MDSLIAYNNIADIYDDIWPGCPHVLNQYRKILLCAKKVLEFGCGTGTYLAALNPAASAGIDMSRKMLLTAQEKLPHGRFVQGNFCYTQMGEKYDAVISPFDTMNHLLNEGEWSAAVFNARKHLRRNGVFAFDVHTPEKMERIVESSPFLISNYRVSVESKDGQLYKWCIMGEDVFATVQQQVPNPSTIEELCRQQFSTVNSHWFEDSETGMPNGRQLFTCRI